VKAGDVLVELDATINAAERDRIAKELVAARLTVARLTAAIAGLADPDAAVAATTARREQRRQTAAEYNRASFNDLAEALGKAASLGEALIQAEQRRQLQTLAAPVDGAVQQLAVHTVGGVVTPAQQLMVIVPADARLEAEAMVSNRDIGFVHAGEPVEVKVDTFNFTRYGLLHGTVASISQDSILRDKPADRPGGPKPGALAETSEPQGQQIKNELVGEECEGIELYPAESRKVDTSNKYHMWCIADPAFRFPVGFRERDVVEHEVKGPSGMRQRGK
jgi:multidrug resistance efflux pump